MDGIVAILEGTATDVGRAIDSGRFRMIDTTPERAGASAASGKARPFTLEQQTLSDGPDQPANVAGTYVHGSHVLRLDVLYAVKRQDAFGLLKEIAADEYDIRRSLMWPLAWAEVSGWTGVEILDSSLEVIGPGENPDLLAQGFDLRVDHREEWG